MLTGAAKPDFFGLCKLPPAAVFLKYCGPATYGFRKHLDGFFEDVEFAPEENDAENEDEAESTGEATKALNLRGLESGWETIHAKELATVQRAMRIAPQASPDDRKDMERLIERVVEAINGGKRDEADAAATELEDLLYYLEDSV